MVLHSARTSWRNDEALEAFVRHAIRAHDCKCNLQPHLSRIDVDRGLDTILAGSQHDEHDNHADHAVSQNVDLFATAATTTAKSAATVCPLVLL